MTPDNLLDEYTTDKSQVETAEGEVDVSADQTMDELCQELEELVPGLSKHDFRVSSNGRIGVKRSGVLRLAEVFAELDRKKVLDEVNT
ncbi:hypothetical protein [Haloarcula vallismortis]|uniref:hypothetical protein n=1 Tax=Haloarcula vallismortis TaxID=28442 RepID=UPI0011146364|nr:hypothetical protein [Haloarcula vallismortis]